MKTLLAYNLGRQQKSSHHKGWRALSALSPQGYPQHLWASDPLDLQMVPYQGLDLRQYATQDSIHEMQADPWHLDS